MTGLSIDRLAVGIELVVFWLIDMFSAMLLLFVDEMFGIVRLFLMLLVMPLLLLMLLLLILLILIHFFSFVPQKCMPLYGHLFSVIIFSQVYIFFILKLKCFLYCCVF